MSNIYEDPMRMAQRVANGKHREVIGGMWDEIGEWQLSFCKSQGLEPSHRLLDIGCGSLRGGVHFVNFLEPDRYAGIDAHEDLLETGYNVELGRLELTSKLDRKQLVATDQFDFSSFEPGFDMAFALSVFTHLDLNKIRLCLERLSKVMKPGARLLASYFEIGADANAADEVDRGWNITTHFDANPFHYRFSDLVRVASGLPVTVERIGNVDHPRGQFMVSFRFGAHGENETVETSRVRGQSADEAMELRAGADHYRAYVGPPRRFDFMSSTQFALLHTFGLREEDKVLDVGCGSLRLGRLLIPFLREDRYFGIDPNEWLIEEGIRRELGRDAVDLKNPKFSYRSDFDFEEFGTQFDFIVAQSVATHTGPDLLSRLLKGAAASLSEDGRFLFSYISGTSSDAPENGWHYPACVEYAEIDMLGRLAQLGLTAKAIPWFHPAASWIVAARHTDCLPSDDDLSLVSGKVIERPTNTKGYVTRR